MKAVFHQKVIFEITDLLVIAVPIQKMRYIPITEWDNKKLWNCAIDKHVVTK